MEAFLLRYVQQSRKLNSDKPQKGDQLNNRGVADQERYQLRLVIGFFSGQNLLEVLQRSIASGGGCDGSLLFVQNLLSVLQ